MPLRPGITTDTSLYTCSALSHITWSALDLLVQTLHCLHSMNNTLHRQRLVPLWIGGHVPQNLLLLVARHVEVRFKQIPVDEIGRRRSSPSVGERSPFLVAETSNSPNDFCHRRLQLAQKLVVVFRQSQDCTYHPVDCSEEQRLPTDEGLVSPTCTVCLRGLLRVVAAAGQRGKNN